MPRPVLATTSLAGCFGCHMSILDIDERIVDLINWVEFDKSPLDDIKHITKDIDIGLIEGGCCNTENVETLKAFRKRSKILVSLGECAIMGGLPAMRNGIPLRECLAEAYQDGPSTYNPDGHLPNDPELPMILNKVHPCHEVVKIDYFLPGCPPSAELIWRTLDALIHNQPLDLPYEVVKFD